jgi:hypothetical protein
LNFLFSQFLPPSPNEVIPKLTTPLLKIPLHCFFKPN